MTDDAHAPTLANTLAATPPQQPTIPVSPDARYVLRSMLGRGGMGEVWLAHDVRIDRDIALKMLRDGRDDADAGARFLREARVQGQLEHPAIVPVHDVGEDGRPYFAMKRLAGTTLADVLAARARGDRTALDRWTRRTLLARLVDVCNAIELAHARRVIHRDLKPANIMLGDFGETYVLDWGLARLLDSDDAERVARASGGGSGSGGETIAGTTMGTPGYMSPEQTRGEPVDARTDVFAIGCILFEILAEGEPAIPTSRAFEVAVEAPHHRPRDRYPDADIPPELDELCARATAQHASDRLSSVREIADGIQRFLDGDRDLARRRELAAAHLAEGMKLIEKSDHESRAEAMRAGARALALDPANPVAQDFVGRLLLQPPKETPVEVREAIELDRARAGQTVFRLGAWTYVVFTIATLVTIALSARHPTPLWIMAGMMVVLCGISFAASARRRVERWLFAALYSLNAALLVMVGLVFGSLLILPVVAIGMLASAVTVPSMKAPRLMTIGLMGSVLVCVLLEQTGVVPPTFVVEGSTIVIDLWAIEISPTVTLGGTLAVFVLQAIATAVLCTAQRRAQERAEERVHVHLWHFRQLVPRS